MPKYRDVEITENRVLLSLNEIVEMTGLSRSYIYALERDGDFPRRLRIGARRSMWRRDAVERWIAGLAAPEHESVLDMNERLKPEATANPDPLAPPEELYDGSEDYGT